MLQIISEGIDILLQDSDEVNLPRNVPPKPPVPPPSQGLNSPTGMTGMTGPSPNLGQPVSPIGLPITGTGPTGPSTVPESVAPTSPVSFKPPSR